MTLIYDTKTLEHIYTVHRINICRHPYPIKLLTFSMCLDCEAKIPFFNSLEK